MYLEAQYSSLGRQVLSSDVVEEIRILAPNGVLGSGFNERSFASGMERKPHFIGVDAGSTDGGPAALGSGKPTFSRLAVKRDLQIILLAARKVNIPLLIGSCGTAGGLPHVEYFAQVVREIAQEQDLTFRLATVAAEPDREYLVRKYEAGEVVPLHPAPSVNSDVFRNTTRIVGMMGAEPFVAALEQGADVILAGRSSDTSIFAAIPVHEGFPAGLCWHAAKILECGAAAATHRKSPDSILGIIRRDHFIIEPLDPDLRCTPQSVAAHSLYENADPYLLTEPGGVVDLRDAVYEENDNRTVRVSGSVFRKADTYTVKLEGADLIGYQTIVIGSVRDPLIIGQLDDWLCRLRGKVAERVADVYRDQLTPDDYVLTIHVYGRNGTMGALEPDLDTPPHEVCLLIMATAQTQEMATAIASMTRHQALHLPIPEWSGLITGLACPLSPAHLERGPVYRFNLNHVVQVDDPLEMFPITLSMVG